MGIAKSILAMDIADLIHGLSGLCGYEESFLWDIYHECMQDGCSLDDFVMITLEDDW